MVIKVNSDCNKVLKKIKDRHKKILVDYKILNKSGEQYIVMSGDLFNIDVGFIQGMNDIEIVMNPGESYYFCGKNFKEKSFICVDKNIIGSGLTVIAGPCAIENYKYLRETAEGVKKSGAHIFRAGAFKPRTTPYNFQGIGREGLKMLKSIKQDIGIPVVSEVMNVLDLELAEECLDLIQVGTRNFTNVALLKELGKIQTPILLKKGFNATNLDLLKAAEFISYNGNDNIILCERGIQTNETCTRFTLDLSSIPVLKELTHLPICIDPSHAAGNRKLVPDLSRAAVFMGADCLEIEVHCNPDDTIKPGDGKQSLNIEQFKKLNEELNEIYKIRKKC